MSSNERGKISSYRVGAAQFMQDTRKHSDRLNTTRADAQVQEFLAKTWQHYHPSEFDYTYFEVFVGTQIHRNTFGFGTASPRVFLGPRV